MKIINLVHCCLFLILVVFYADMVTAENTAKVQQYQCEGGCGSDLK